MSYNIDYNSFKTDINLTQYCASIGYQIDNNKSTKTSIAMKSGNDKVIITKKGGKWVYFGVSAYDDNGSIIDFIKNRTNKPIKEIGLELKAWLGGDISTIEPKSYISEVKEQVFDPMRIKNIFKGCKPITKHDYLTGRGISNAVINCQRFTGRIFSDRYKNVLFPHFKHDGICSQICGIEYKQTDKAFFAKGSEKTFWRSNAKATDTTLIIGEAVIDALSHYVLRENDNGTYLVTGGGMSPDQGPLLIALINSRPLLEEIIIITDNDKGGDLLTMRLKEVIAQSHFKNEPHRHSPEISGFDWNDELNQQLEEKKQC